MSENVDQATVQNSYQQGFEQRIINYVPGEVCIVVEPANLPANPEAGRALYDDVQQRLKEWILAHLSDPRPANPDSFDQDLDPGLLRRRLAGHPSVLRPLARLTDQALAPWILLPAIPADPDVAQDGRTATALLFYQIGTATWLAHPDDLQALDEQRELVRELTNWINSRIDEVSRSVRGAATNVAKVVAASPNWLKVGAADTCGGPGGVPELAPVPSKGQPLIRFADSSLEEYAAPTAELGDPLVIVAVLDTCPAREYLDGIAGTANPPSSWLFHELYPKIKESIEGPASLSIKPPSFSHLAQIRLNWRGPEADPAVPEDHFQMPDHGLFVTGIVHHLAPHVGLSLTRVLDDCGRGDTHLLARVLDQLPSKLLANPNQKLVINLSLVSDVPFNLQSGADFADPRLARWLPRTVSNADTQAARQVDILRVLGLAHENLRRLFIWPRGGRVVVVAAAGNDAFLPRPPDQPRYPAAYPAVIGVAAVKAEQVKADYSNPGDEVTNPPSNPFNGIATYGGNADPRLPPGGGPPRINLEQQPVDAIRGIFTAESFPFGGKKNDTGWAYWIGTSFATPIVTAVAANYWRTHPTATAGDVQDYILKTWMPVGGNLPAGIRAPVIHAWPV